MRLVLGSKSPRRRELLNSMGFQFEIRTFDTDESFPDSLMPEEVALYVARKKSKDLLTISQEDEVVLCADTVVIIDDLILGKPVDKQAAVKMLESLSGRNHKVITGVSIVSLEKAIEFSVTTEVYFHPISGSDIDYYIDNFKPFDKAGAYGIQEWIGYTSIQKIVGSYNNVVGLPTHEVYQALKSFE